MSQPYVGEIRIFGFNFVPAGWAYCNGAILPISENDTLFNLIGTTYGGDGQTTFALPDLRGRAGVHQGNGYTLAETSGVEATTLTLNQIPAHTHAVTANSNPANTDNPAGAYPANTAAGGNSYSNGANATMNAGMLALAGSGLPHNNLQPYLTLNYCISLFGIFPSQS